MSTGAYVVRADTTVVWDGGSTFVRRGTIVQLDPAGPLGAAYGGPGNLAPLRATQTGGDADHAETGN